jgi:hypothetical protein
VPEQVEEHLGQAPLAGRDLWDLVEVLDHTCPVLELVEGHVERHLDHVHQVDGHALVALHAGERAQRPGYFTNAMGTRHGLFEALLDVCRGGRVP